MNPGSTHPIAVLVVDDQRPFRTAARRMLDADVQFTVVGEAGSGEEAIALAPRLRPGLILMDVLLPGMDGIAATRQILAANPDVIVVLVSTRRRSELPASIEDCGAAGFLQKESVDPDALGALIR